MTVAEYTLHGSRLHGRDLRQTFNELQSRLTSLMTDYDANLLQNFTNTYEINNEITEPTQVISAAAIDTSESVCDIEESKPVILEDNNAVMTKLSSSSERKKLIISSQRARQNITIIKRVITATTKPSDTTQNLKSRTVNTTKLIIDTSNNSNNNNTKKLGGKSSPEHIEKLIGKEVTTPRKVTTPLLSTSSVKKTVATTVTTPMHKATYATPSKSVNPVNITASTPNTAKGMSRTPRPSRDPSDKFVKPTGLPNKLSLDMPPPSAKPTKNVTKLSFDSAVKKPPQAGEECNKAVRQSAPMESTKLFGLINSKSTMAMTPVKAHTEAVSNDDKISPKRVAENPFMSLVGNQPSH